MNIDNVNEGRREFFAVAATASTLLMGASGAIAATSLRSPMGAMGGAINGATVTLVTLSSLAINEAFPIENPIVNTSFRIVSLVSSFFISMGLSVVIQAAFGLPMSLVSASELFLRTALIGLPIILGLGCCLGACVSLSSK